MPNEKAKILIIEDHHNSSLQEILCAEMYESIVANSEEKALKYLLQNDFAVIVIDESFFSKREMIETVKNREGWKHTSVIFITSKKTESECENFVISKGTIDYVSRPINPYLINSKINTFVEIFLKQKELDKKRLFWEQKLMELQDSYDNLEKLIIDKTAENIRLKDEIFHLDRVNKVGEIAAGIAHEIRNPMTTVLGFLQLSVQENDVKTPKHIVHLMIDELTRANSIISEYLHLTKNRASQIEKIDLNEILKTLHPLLQAEAILTRKTIELDLCKDCSIDVDDKEIRQLILNLTLNGLESMEASGVLTIKTSVEKNQIVLAIQDQGHGIDKEILNKVGTPFFTTKEKGTGLGLAICYQIASRYEANIEIESKKSGTTFFVRFPIK